MGLIGLLPESVGVVLIAEETKPRADLKVVAGGVHLTPPMGLTTWAAFTRSGAHTMVMGDMCLTEDQVNPVMSVALDNGLEVTALHNHFFWDERTATEPSSRWFVVTIWRLRISHTEQCVRTAR